MITVYVDGACSNGAPIAKGVTNLLGMGGWAWWVDDHFWDSGAVNQTTNNRMELTAVIQALRTMKAKRTHERLLIVSDSAYVVNCFHDRWYDNWIANDWRSAAGKPVKNQDLWKDLVGLWTEHGAAITFRHCRGHGKGGPADAPHVAGNAQADRLAVAARRTLERG